MKWLLLASALTFVQCRPQEGEPTKNAAFEDLPVEIEKQKLLEIHPQSRQLNEPKIEVEEKGQNKTTKSVEERTKQILEKIAEVNKKQGLVPKKRRPDYFHFPFSYSRSESKNQPEVDGFKFPSNPFTNPIFEYMEKESSNSNRDSPESNVKFITHIVDGPGQTDESTNVDVPPGHYIKRKIVHKQTLLMPLSQQYPPSNLMASPIIMNHPFGGTVLPDEKFNNVNKEKDKTNSLNMLEKETIDNIKNIVLSSQLPLQTNYYNPYGQTMDPFYALQNPYVQNYFNGYQNVIPNMANAVKYNYQMYGPYVVPNVQNDQVTPRQQFQWPWQQFFPIIIKDPMVQMMNAVTSMVEFGPTRPGGGGGGACKHAEEIKSSERTGKKLNTDTLMYEIKNENTAPEITIKGSNENLEQNITTLDIEDLVIKTNTNNQDKVTVGFKSWKATERQGKVSGNVSTKVNVLNNTKETSRTSSKLSKTSDEVKNNQARISLIARPSTATKPATDSQQWLPVRDKPTYEDEKEEEAETDKAEDISVSHDGNKKLFSKDNTGSGIFIHKLKVRKGGVAIAGPGGIATAGSGGTAIVGPHGVAYTHPDSLAIAGSGTKVVAVDPNINLGDLINNTNKDWNTPRVGKVVAVGPVVYYNRGYITFPNGLRFPKWLPHPGSSVEYFGTHQQQPLSHKSSVVRNVVPITFALNNNIDANYQQYYHFTKYHQLTYTNKQVTEATASQLKNSYSETGKPKPVVAHVQHIGIVDKNKSSKLQDPQLNALDTNMVISVNNENSLAPYRAHPLFEFLKNGKPLDNTIHLRSASKETRQPTTATLILKPVARAIAGVEGKAISTPKSKAFLRQGMDVDILFEPDAIAIAGPGGVAHAESDLEITYEDIIP